MKNKQGSPSNRCVFGNHIYVGNVCACGKQKTKIKTETIERTGMNNPITERDIDNQTDAVEQLFAEMRVAKRWLAWALHERHQATEEERIAAEAETAYTQGEGKLSAMRAQFALQECERLTAAKRQLESQIRQAANLPEKNLRVCSVCSQANDSGYFVGERYFCGPCYAVQPRGFPEKTKAQENAEAVYPNGRYASIEKGGV